MPKCCRAIRHTVDAQHVFFAPFHHAALTVRIFKLFRAFFLSSGHLYHWTESLYCVVLAGADRRTPASIADHLVVLGCIIPYIKHPAPSETFLFISWNMQAVRQPTGNCTGHDLSSLCIGDCGLRNSRLEVTHPLASFHLAYSIMAIPVAPDSDLRAYSNVHKFLYMIF